MAEESQKNSNDDMNTQVSPESFRKLDLDTILREEIGQFGKYQLRIFLLSLFLVIFVAWSAVEYMFTTARINTRCLIPECEGEPTSLSPYWLINAVPQGEQCERFASVNATTRVVDSNTCPASFFDRNTRVPCDDFVYQNTHSVVYDYGLACEEWKRSLIGTVRTFGTLTALPITGFVSDRWGRRVALVLNAFNTAWLGVTRYWADTYIGFMMSEFVEATFGSGGFSCVYILIMELVGPKYRVAAGAVLNTTFALGQVTMGLIAWGVPNWRKLTLTLYIPQFLTIFYFWLISESIRWYMSKGRFDESEALLRKVAKINGKHVSDKSLETLRRTAQEKLRISALEAEKKGGEPWLIVQVFRHKKILLRVLISPVWWITTTLVYYGLSLNAVNMSGNRYLNYVAVAAIEIPGYWIAYFLMDRIGRKPVLAGSFWLCAACQIAYIFISQDLYAVSLTVYLIAKMAIASVVVSVYVYTAELYPTKYRHSLFAFSSMMGRIGSMLAPLTPAFGSQWFEELPFVLFGSFALLSGILIFLTPETLGQVLPDTFKQAEEIGFSDKTNKCLIPECESEPTSFSPYWLVNAVPQGEQCERFAVNATMRVVDSNTCPAFFFDRNTRVPCDDFVYQNTHSVVYDLGLACQEWKRSLIGTVRTFGSLTALPITGFISDRWGRRVALVLNAFNTAWLGVTRYWADTYIGFMMSEFVEATFGSGGFTCAYILVMELVGPKFRVAAGAVMNTTFAVGQVLMGLIAWGVPNWRKLTLTLYIPQFLTIFYFWLISESIRWYMSKGRFDESEALLRKVARVNGKHLSEKSLEALRRTAQEKLRISALEAEKRGGEPWLVVQVFRHKKILLRVLVSPVWWITTTFIYYGLSLNAVNMSGNRYVNYMAVAAVEIPGYWIAYFLMDKIGRKPVLTGSFWLCAACQIAYIFISQDLYAVSLTVYLIAKMAIAAVGVALYVYTAELYPTKHRHSLFAFSSMIGRIGSMLAPLTPAFGSQWFEELPFVLFGSFALLSGLLIFLTPETLGHTLPDTFEQAEEIGLKDKTRK